MLLAPGARLGGYEIVDSLGAGGMGEVYRAYDPKLNRRVAIKILNLDSVRTDAAVRRFEQEARAASALNHPGIVTIHDTGESDGRYYIVMELVEGVTLRHWLHRGQRPLKKVLHIASQLADALAKAHEAGVVHRDLKPENVMVTTDDHVKIVDFGLAKLNDRPAFGSKDSATESARGVMMGTVGYMAPEQVRGEPADSRADQFAFGAILYELVTGARAFARSTTVDTLSMILNDEPASVAATTPMPAPLWWLIERCLAKDARDRYTSTRDLAQDLRTLRDRGSELIAGDKASPAMKRRTIAMIGALVLVLAAVAYLAFQSLGTTAVVDAIPPTVTQVTFGRGHLVAARFAPDGKTILYAASWNGAPVQIFETHLTGPESRPLGPAGAGLASISSKGEIALILGCRFDWANCVGTLAQMPPGGGAPREVLENVIGADWAPDGQTLAAIHLSDGEYQLQCPPGKPLYKSTSKIGYLRFSPRGDRIAFVEYELISEEDGIVKIVDLHGQVQSVGNRWRQIRDIAWAPDGNEIWVSAGERNRSGSLYAVSLSGARRRVLDVPGAVFLQDLASDGRVLVAQGSARASMLWAGPTGQRDLSWLDWSTVADMSADGKTVLFHEWGQAVNANPVVYLRSSAGSEAIRLGEGKALALSPDGRLALAIQDTPRPHLVLLPTGAGVSRELPVHGLTDFYWARWFHDGQRLLVVGEDENRVPGSYIQDLATGRLEPIGDKGLLAVLVSPDGERVLVNDPLEGYILWPLKGAKPRALQSLDRNHRPIQWSADGRFLFVRDADESVARIHRFELATGRSELLKELAPPDPAGVVGIADGRGELAVTPDGNYVIFTYWTFFRNLFMVEGLPRRWK